MKEKNKIYLYINFFLIFITFLYLANFILLSDFLKLISLIPDDASYYLKIAQNYSKHSAFTFDGINVTNGFQPLWQFLLVGIFGIFELFKISNESFLRFVLFFQLLLITGSALITTQILSLYFDKIIILLSGVFFIAFLFTQSLNGMETSLMLFLITLLLYIAAKLKIFSERNVTKEIFWGFGLGLLMLSRLDTIFIVSSLILFSLWDIIFNSNNKKNDLIRISIIAAAAMLTVIPYLINNYLTFSNFIPISGILKSGFEMDLMNKLQLIFSYRESYFAVTAIIYFIWFLFSIKRLRNTSNYFFCLSLGVLSLGLIFLFFYQIFFMNWFIFYWYFILYSFFMSLSVCLPAKYCLSFKKFNAGKNFILLVIFLVASYWGYKIYINYNIVYDNSFSNWNVESYKAAQWTKENINETDNMAMKDAGHFGFFSERNVINLDGLVNNFDFQEILKGKKLNDYLKQNRVKYLVQHAVWDRAEVVEGKYDSLKLNYMSHRYSLESDPVIVTRQNEVYRSLPYYDGLHKTVFLIWKLNQ